MESLERVPCHLQDNHGIRTTLRQEMIYLGLESEVMTIAEVEDCAKGVLWGTAVMTF